jgi:outer membrane immunogenic protein
VLGRATDSSTRVGWTAGAGVQYAAWGNWAIGAEYLHYDLGNINLTAVDTRFAAPSPTLFGKAEISGDIVRGTLTYRFGGPVVARY